MEQIVADELAVFPGMEELANLLYIMDYHNSGDYDVIIVDCAPTGETLRFSSFPEVLRWWMDKMFPIGRTAITVAQPFVRHVMGIPVPEDRVFQSIENLYTKLDGMRTLLTDPQVGGEAEPRSRSNKKRGIVYAATYHRADAKCGAAFS